MKRAIGLLLLLGFVVIPFMAADRTPAAAKEALAASPFALKDTEGKQVSLADFKDKKAIAIVFIGTECPVNNFYCLVTLPKLHEEFAPKGVQFLAINSNNHDTIDKIAEHAKANKLPFPVLVDPDHKIADMLKAERTPEALVLDSKLSVVYRGRIDDHIGIGFQRQKPTRRDLAEAITEVVDGKPVSVSKTVVSGCIIGREKKADANAKITYSNQIARIFQKNCLECHHPGTTAPFSLLTYEKAKGWADMIREVVSENRMPPWHADPQFGKFSNDRRMSKQDKETLLAWIDQGCPKGDEKDLPPAKQYAEGWIISKPDVVLMMEKEIKVPASGGKNGVPYMYVNVPTNFTEDKWVQQAEARPGNRSVVHHIIINVRSGNANDPTGRAGLVGTAPGDMPLILPPGFGKKVPKGAILSFQMHYTPNGVETTDRSMVGLVFCKEPPKYIVNTGGAFQTNIRIPPGDGNHKVVSTVTFRKDTMLTGFMPHMHLRGKDFKYEVEYPDGRKDILLSVPRYDFAWQTQYRLATHLLVPKGTKMTCTAHFDNSENNASNPDPTQLVRWGDQTWEEMMIGWYSYYHPDEEVKVTKTDAEE